MVIVESDDWSVNGQSIMLPETLAKIRLVLQKKGPIILQHKFYRGARSPETIGFDEYEDFLAYLTTQARPGDKFTVWDFAELCKDENSLVLAKYPDVSGRTPRLGAY